MNLQGIKTGFKMLRIIANISLTESAVNFEHVCLDETS